LTTYRKSYMKNRLVPKWMTLSFVYRSFKVRWTIASHSPLNITETVRDRGLVPKDHNRKLPMVNRTVTWPMTSRDPERSRRDPNTLRVQYRENNWI